jgi:hypothetical protein
MLKLGKFAIAFALALMGLSLLTSGVFAQSTKTNHNSSVRTAVATTTLQGVQQNQRVSNTQQVTQKLNWGPRRGWGGGWRRGWGGGWGHRFHHRFFRHRFFRHRFFHRRFFRRNRGGW